VIILGGGPNRIGQGIEFDYCCVHASMALAELGLESIMINCNPETVSTDYDTSDRLYFEPLTLEDVLAICERERPWGVIVQFGGQTPLKLAVALTAAGVPILGTSADAIDRAEDRERFGAVLDRLALRAPAWGIAHTLDQARTEAARIGYPVMIRPSYVLGGRAMERIYDAAALEDYFVRNRLSGGDGSAAQISFPLLVDQFLHDAVELDVDVVADATGAVVVGGVMEHIEEAGIHSGDSACALPPYSLPPAIVDEVKRQARALAIELGVVGLMNAQFAVHAGLVYILEVNPRASRTVPFVSKAIGVPLAKVAAKVMAGRTLAELGVVETVPPHVSVKESVFPFVKFEEVDTILGPEMKSTGEVMGLGPSFAEAYLKAQEAAGVRLPTGGVAFLSVRDSDKAAAAELAADLVALGFAIVATHGTARSLEAAGLAVRARSTRSSTAGPTASTRWTTARSTSSSTPPRAPRPSSIRSRCGAARCATASPTSRPSGGPGRRSRRSRLPAPKPCGCAPSRGTNDLSRAVRLRPGDAMADKFPMTPAGQAWMRKQLKRLKEVDRPNNAKAIEIARGHGDLSENADYSAAKEEQGMIEAKIREYDSKLALAEVIDPTKLSGDRVQFGATVTIEDTDTGETAVYTIVGEHEADIKKRRISLVAPVARGLLGKRVGDEVTITTPKGKREFTIAAVEWLEVGPPDEE
jgi:transcription elongation factor GreA